MEKFDSLESVQSPELQVREWSVDEAAKIVFNTYRFSQGFGSLQRNIFEWLAINVKDRKLPYDVSEITSKVTEMSKRYFKSGAHTAVEGDVSLGIQAEIKQWQNLEHQLSNNPNLSNGDVLKWLTKGIISRDGRFLNAVAQHRDDEVPGDIKRVDSQFVKYALNSTPTGSKFFDTMFSQIKDYYTEHPELFKEEIDTVEKIKKKQ